MQSLVTHVVQPPGLEQVPVFIWYRQILVFFVTLHEFSILAHL